MKTMTTLQLQKIDSLLKELPDEKVQMAMNFILWLKQSDEVLTDAEVKKIKKARKEKSGISWKKLKTNLLSYSLPQEGMFTSNHRITAY